MMKMELYSVLLKVSNGKEGGRGGGGGGGGGEMWCKMIKPELEKRSV